MECELVKLELAARSPGELPPEVEAHLSSCPACAEEANAMKGLGKTIKRGLAEWADQGAIPPDLAAQIERSVRQSARRRPWYATWQAGIGGVAAAALILVALAGTSPEVAHSFASVPLLGTIAAQFLPPDLEVRLDGPAPESLADLAENGGQTVAVNLSDERNGIILTVQRMQTSPSATHIEYTVKGVTLDKSAAKRYQPQLKSAQGPVHLQSYTAVQRGGEVVFNAYFTSVPAGQALNLTLDSLSVSTQGSIKWVQGPWAVSFQN